MLNREALQKRLLATFREEASEHVQALDAALQPLLDDVSSTEARGHLETLFRVMHTLKGASRSVRFTEVEEICQEAETLLRGLTQGDMALQRAHVFGLRETIAKLQSLIFRAASESPAPSAAPPAAPPAAAPAAPSPAAAPPASASPVPGNPAPAMETAPPSAPGATPAQPAAAASAMPESKGRIDTLLPTEARPEPMVQSVRVGIEHLDKLMLAAEDLLVPSLIGRERAREARRLAEDVGSLRRRVLKAGRMAGMAEERGAALENLRDIEQRCRRLALALGEDQRSLNSTANALFRETRQARMLPASALFEAFPAMVRDLCIETGRQAKWRIKGANVQLDRKVIEAVKNPLIHMVRNAVDHGIEPPAERQAAGKPARGKITASIFPLDGGRVAIEIIDDGRGMDIAALRGAALRARVATKAQIDALPDRSVIDLAFRSGISTRSVISNLSGMGLGLSIVQEQIERIDRVVGLSRADAAAALDTGILVQDDRALPFGRLSDLLELPKAPAPSTGVEPRLVSCVIVSSGGRRAAFAVSSVLGETDVLVKDMPQPLRRVLHIASAGLLPTGDITLVLRPSDLVATAQTGMKQRRREVAEAGPAAKKILVVDDSLTTRTMERNLLEAVGYEVEIAADGLEAWSVLQGSDVDLVVSDVDMPRMNGFDLTARIRADARLAELPVVLVTAMESREDRHRGIQIGANAYVLKSAFDQSNLLEIVGRLI